MKKMNLICGLVGFSLLVGGCSKTNETKEIKIVHEHHIFIHSNNAMDKNHRMHGDMKRMHEQKRNQKFGQSKGGIDPRYDHKPGMMPPKKQETVKE